MNEQHITRALEDLAGERVPADLDLWPVMRARMRLVRQARPATALRWAGLVGLPVVLLGALIYGAVLLVQQLRPADSPPVVQVSSARPLHLIQAIEGITVSLQHVYVDASSVVVALAISSTDAQGYIPYQITLTNAVGAILSQTVGYCVADRPDRTCYRPAPQNGLYLFLFSGPPMSEITSTALVESLRLAVRLKRLDVLTSTQLVTDTHDPPAGPAPGMFIGPFQFDFSLPPRYLHGSQSLGLPLQPEDVLDRAVADREFAAMGAA